MSFHCRDRDYKARFLQPGTPDYAMAKQWRELEEEGQAQQKKLEQQLGDDQHKLEYEFEANMHDQEAEYFRQGLLLLLLSSRNTHFSFYPRHTLMIFATFESLCNVVYAFL